jgi:hypothetical protein
MNYVLNAIDGDSRPRENWLRLERGGYKSLHAMRVFPEWDK